MRDQDMFALFRCVSELNAITDRLAGGLGTKSEIEKDGDRFAEVLAKANNIVSKEIGGKERMKTYYKEKFGA